MGLRMPSPTRHPKTSIFLYRARVPADLAQRMKGEELDIPVAGEVRRVTAGAEVKVSLGTRDPAEAKRRFIEVEAAVEAIWSTKRTGPLTLNFMQRQALAGEVYHWLVRVCEQEPGSADRWFEMQDLMDGALSLPASPDNPGRAWALEVLVAPQVDRTLKRRGLSLTSESRKALLVDTVDALTAAYRDIGAMAQKDYTSKRFPSWQLSSSKEPAAPSSQQSISFESIIDAEAVRRSAGKDAVAIRERTIKKFRRECASLAEHRGSEDAASLTPAEIRAWIAALQAEGRLSNKTIGHALTDTKTVWRWGRKMHPEAFPSEDPFASVDRPTFQDVASDERTYTLSEARSVLLAARQATKPELRWLPWMSAFSGARISELSALRKDDFYEVDGLPFYRLTKAGGRTLKSRNSERRIPVHPALVAEGLLRFVAGRRAGRLFPVRSNSNVGDWIKDTVGITREHVAPNHGWRHLFEDLLTNAGVPDDVRNYLVGHATGSARDRYGRSEASLPGLHREMAKIEPLLPVVSAREAAE